MTDPGRSGGEETGWHMHAATFDRHATVHNEVYRCDAPLGDPRPVKPVLVLDPVTARDTIARAALDWTLERTLPDEEWAALGDEDREQVYALAAALLAALASQERGE